jgi:hypothetical protein
MTCEIATIGATINSQPARTDYLASFLFAIYAFTFQLNFTYDKFFMHTLLSDWILLHDKFFMHTFTFRLDFIT